MKALRKIIFWSHLIAGVSAGLVIFSMSFSGVILMYEPQISDYAERDARRMTPSAKRLSYDELIAKVRQANPGAHPALITVKADPRASVSVNFGRDKTLFVDPYSGEILGNQSRTRNFLRDVVEWHRWFGVEGEGRATARAVTGACNLVFFWLAVTGVYLWWPRSWNWRALKSSLLFNARLRAKARDWNWHNVIGFWSSSVLIVLTLTAAVMSYPWANDLLYTLTGSEPPRRSDSPAGSQAAHPRSQRGEQRATAQAASYDVLLARSQAQVPDWIMIMLRLPPRGDGPVIASIQGPDAFHPFQRSQLTLDRASGEIVKWEPYRENSAGRKLRTWVRALHTGEAFGVVGQTVAGVASLGGCFLVWTGLAMAWRRFRSWRHESENFTSEESFMNVNSDNAIPSIPHLGEAGNSDAVILQALNEAPTIPPNGATNGHGPSQIPQGFLGTYASTPVDSASVLVLYGTVTGNAEMLANRLAKRLHLKGLTARVSDMAHCQPRELALFDCALVITSTYGDGEPPEDAAPFWQAVVQGNSLDLTGLKFSVLALGNTTYDHFCKCGRDFDAALERHGATRFYPRVDCDADYDVAAATWMEGVLSHFQRQSLAASA